MIRESISDIFAEINHDTTRGGKSTIAIGAPGSKKRNMSIADPDKNEMLTFLQTTFGNEEGFEFDAEAAIYWFANFNHGGQNTNLYSALSMSEFNPGPMSRGPEPGSSEEMMYNALEDEYGKNQADDIQTEASNNTKYVKSIVLQKVPHGYEVVLYDTSGNIAGEGLSTFSTDNYSEAIKMANHYYSKLNGKFKMVDLTKGNGQVTEEEQPEPYDDRTNTFAPSPRPRGEDWEAGGDHNKFEGRMLDWVLKKYNTETDPKIKDALFIVQRLLAKSRGMDKSNFPTNEAASNKPVNVTKLSTPERNAISKAFAKVGLDGNQRFEKKELGLRAIQNALASLGFQLDMVSADSIMGDKGSRNFIFRRANDEGQDAFTEKPEIQNSRIVFNWENLNNEGQPSRFECIAYVS